MKLQEMSKERIKFIFRIVIVVLILLLTITCIVLINKVTSKNNEISIYEQNQKALTDSVRYEKNKYGELIAVKNILVSDKKNLESLNKDLANELKKTNGNVKEIIKIVSVISPKDTIYIPIYDYSLIDSNGIKQYGLVWNHDTIYDINNSRKLSGITYFDLDSIGITPKFTKITKDELKFDLITGIRENKGNIEIFAKSNHPSLQTISLDGAIIDPQTHPVLKKFTKQKRFGIGPYLGGGINTNLYPTTNFGFGFSFGIGIHYSIIRF